MDKMTKYTKAVRKKSKVVLYYLCGFQACSIVIFRCSILIYSTYLILRNKAEKHNFCC